MLSRLNGTVGLVRQLSGRIGIIAESPIRLVLNDIEDGLL
jgi:hypothetical protein